MADNLPPTETDTPNTVTNISGGVNVNAQGDVNIGGDVVGRDKITQIITNIFQSDTAQRDARNRCNMLERVKNDWVKGVLEKSLYHEVMLDLGLEERPDEIQHPWDMTLQMPERENRALPPGTKIMRVFDDANHALLILGEPGSGKTTMLLELARDTIARAEQDPTQPIPVVFNLSSWSVSPKLPIADWLVKELHDKYGVHMKIAQPWIENDDLLLLLDGLDEVNAEYREACVKAINNFRNEHGQTQLVICSRITDYEALTTQLKLLEAVLIQALTSEQIDEYLVGAGDERSALRQALKYDTDLQVMAQSPLMLSIMIVAYREMFGEAIGGITRKQLETIEDRRKHLLEAYTQKMFSRVSRNKNERYPKEQTLPWLTWLARGLTQHAQSGFFLDQLSPTWLSTHQQRLHRLFSGVVVHLGGGLILGLFIGLIVALVTNPISGWYIGLIGGLLGGLILGGTTKEFERPFTTLSFSLKETLKGLIVGLRAGLIIGLVGVFFGALANGLTTGLGVGLMLMGLIVVLGGTSGLRTVEVRTRSTPNQVIRQSMKLTIFAGLFTWLVVILVIGLGLMVGLGGPSLENLRIGLLFGAVVGLFGGLEVGLFFQGQAIISHFILRFILYRNDKIPWNYVRFLDYAAERIFLRKVGGGYIFIHRMLLEYFAELEKQSGTPSDK
jgi:MFS family permease